MTVVSIAKVTCSWAIVHLAGHKNAHMKRYALVSCRRVTRLCLAGTCDLQVIEPVACLPVRPYEVVIAFMYTCLHSTKVLGPALVQ